jgi:hypothetical protein
VLCLTTLRNGCVVPPHICACTHTYAHTNARTHIHVHTCTHAHIHACTHTCIHTYMHKHTKCIEYLLRKWCLTCLLSSVVSLLLKVLFWPLTHGRRTAPMKWSTRLHVIYPPSFFHLPLWDCLHFALVPHSSLLFLEAQGFFANKFCFLQNIK